MQRAEGQLVTPGHSKSSSPLTSIHKVRSLFAPLGRPTSWGDIVRRNLWIGPLLALVSLAFVGFWLRLRIEQAMQMQAEEELRALLDADVTALTIWLRSEEANASTAAQAAPIRQPVLELAKLTSAGEPTAAALLAAPQKAQLDHALQHWLKLHGYAGYAVFDRQARVLAATNDHLVGQKVAVPGDTTFVETVFSGRALVSRPFPSFSLIEDEWGQLSAGVPTMFAAAPLKNHDGLVVAALALRIRPDQQFTRILNVARYGKSGETYAFDRRGVLLSRTRFEDQLKQLGLLADQPRSRSLLAVEIRDPGVDMTKGHRPEQRRSEQPLTHLASEAVSGRSGVDVEGYRDYRGVESIGAWTWLPEYGMGVGTEIDKVEAFRPMGILRAAFWTLFGLLAAAAILLFVLTLVTGRLDRRVREATIAAGQLGQYALEQKIGQGGMGSVYRGRH
ncbi:MAG TPA: serine/threonine protein kinase, partial [Pirellulales bacterium]|nr:serine/threonine protein kinase [Pirellulales bacterium]